MTTSRLEAFSDGVLAIVITIMVLELKVPEGGDDLAALHPLVPLVLSYVLSFLYLGIYWNNHHHLLQATERVSGSVLWANLHLLFWLSLIPFTTAWLGATSFAPVPMALYGANLLLAAMGWWVLQRRIVCTAGFDSALARALGRDLKGNLSLATYAVAIPLSLWLPWLAAALYILVAVIWVVPDRRLEQAYADAKASGRETAAS